MSLFEQTQKDLQKEGESKRDKKFKHYIITRFNLRLYWDGSPIYDNDKVGKAVRTDEWLLNRFKLFEKYCLPSFVQQETQDFVWLCLFDEETPEAAQSTIRGYQSLCANFRPCYLTQGQMADLCGYLKTCIREDADAQVEYIVTTRVDSDDFIHKQMVARIHELVENNADEVVYSFSNGLQYVEKYNIVKGYHYPGNHFLTRVEKNNDMVETIMKVAHSFAFRTLRQINVANTTPMWGEVVHDTNAANDVRFSYDRFLHRINLDLKMIFKYSYLEDFGVNVRLSNIRLFLYLKMLFVTVYHFLRRNLFKMKTPNQ